MAKIGRESQNVSCQALTMPSVSTRCRCFLYRADGIRDHMPPLHGTSQRSSPKSLDADEMTTYMALSVSPLQAGTM